MVFVPSLGDDGGGRRGGSRVAPTETQTFRSEGIKPLLMEGEWQEEGSRETPPQHRGEASPPKPQVPLQVPKRPLLKATDLTGWGGFCGDWN